MDKITFSYGRRSGSSRGGFSTRKSQPPRNNRTNTKNGRDYSLQNKTTTDTLVDVFYHKNKRNELNTERKYSYFWMQLSFWSRGIKKITSEQRKVYSTSLSNLTKSTLPLVEDMSARSVATVANAVANVSKRILGTGAQNEPWPIKMLESLAKQALDVVGDMNSQEVANTAWAFATLGVKDDALLDALAKQAVDVIGEMNSQGVANTAWAFATLGVKDDALLDALAKQALDVVGGMNSQEVANTAWAYATLGVKNEDLFDALAKQALDVVGDMNPQDVATTAWSMARMDCRDNDIFTALFTRADVVMTSSTCILALHSVAEALDYFSCHEGDLTPFSSLVKIVKDANLLEPTSSGLHKSVSSTLKSMKVKHLNEQRIGYSSFVDILIAPHKLVIEVDGPHHERPLQRRRDEFKSQLLTVQGYTVCRISYRQWNKFTTPQQKIEYLQQILGEFSSVSTSTPEEPYTTDFAKTRVLIPRASQQKPQQQVEASDTKKPRKKRPNSLVKRKVSKDASRKKMMSGDELRERYIAENIQAKQKSAADLRKRVRHRTSWRSNFSRESRYSKNVYADVVAT